MRRTLGRLLVLACGITAFLAAIPVAQAGTATNHVVNAAFTSNTVETHGQTTTDAGIIHDKSLGTGAGLLFVKQGSAADKLDFRAKIWYDAGVQRAAGTVTISGHPDGSVSFIGNGHFTGGTRKFAGITGKLKISGAVTPTGLTVTSITGNARY